MTTEFNKKLNQKAKDQIALSISGKTRVVAIPYNQLPHDTPMDEARLILGELPEGWSLVQMFAPNNRKITNLCFEKNQEGGE